jgi:sporulation protein YlmC with PRC-barrel domain
MEKEYEDLMQSNFIGKYKGDANPNLPLKFLTAKSIIGEKVINNQGEHLGHIRDIMLDIRIGRIEYYVIEFGGFMGLGEKLFAIPFELLMVDTNEKVFRFNEKKETLKQAPGFDKKHWPETNEHKRYYVNESWSFWNNPI